MKLMGIMVAALATTASAQPECLHRWRPWEPQRNSLFFIKDQPGFPVQSLRVSARVATNLMFPMAVDPARTKLTAADGRFEPLMISGRSVVVVPLYDLAEEESFPLLVTLKDGTSIPFNLLAPRLRDSTDGQIDVFLHQEETPALQQALLMARSRAEELAAENDRHQQEEFSVNHALAALLAQGKKDLTPFYVADSHHIEDGGVDVNFITFRVKKGRNDHRRAAVAFSVTNKDAKKPWVLDEVRLMSMTTGAMKAFALRTSSPSIDPGKTGMIALVMDIDVFGTGAESDRLALELWRAGPLTRQARVELVAVEENDLPVRVEGRLKIP